MTEDVQIVGGTNEKLQSQLYIGKYAFLWLAYMYFRILAHCQSSLVSAVPQRIG